MRTFTRVALACALALLATSSVWAQDKALLAVKGTVGQTARYRTQGTLSIEVSGMKMDAEMAQMEKMTVAAVGADGSVTLERVTESVEITVAGQKLPADEARSSSTMVVNPNGSVASYKSSDEGEAAKMGRRLLPTGSAVFKDTPVGVGDKWSHAYKADDESGAVAGTADFEVLGFEKAAGVDAVKLALTYRETAGSPAVASKGTLWVEKTSGDVVQADIEVENMPGPGGATMGGKLHVERTEGAIYVADGSTAKPGAKPDAKPETKPEPKKEKTIDEVVKDFEKLPGLLTLYKKRDAGRDTIYAEIREDQLDQLMLVEATASTGTGAAIAAGDPLADLLVKFVKSGDEKIHLVTPNIGFRAKEGTPMHRAVRRSFPDGILEAFKVEAKQPDRRSMLINLTDYFRGDVAQVAQRLGGGGILGGAARGGSYSLDREKTYVSTLKAFPDNVLVETTYHFTRSGGVSSGLEALLGGGAETLADPRSVPMKVTFNVFGLPNDGYRPRLADPRVGYFSADFMDFDNYEFPEPDTRYILRWHVEKADPKAALSAPKKPIVFWMDNAIPVAHRPAVREGLLYWNRAFEKIGIKDAIVVKQMPDDADWDHADMRYNTIRWVTSPASAYAVALFRANPLTGQIINANITVDANIVMAAKMDRTQVVEPSSHFEEKTPSLSADPRHCQMASEAVRQAQFGLLALRMLAPAGLEVSEKQFVHAFIRSIVAHEMGHIMGLRHNFQGSTASKLADLSKPAVASGGGLTASIMDYLPFNVAALKRKGGHYWAPTLGAYDLWAIEYGYKPISAPTTQSERPALKTIASRTNQPGLGYQSDEIADQFDPYVVRNDLSANPLDWAERLMQTTRYLMLNMDRTVPRKGEGYDKFSFSLRLLLGMYASAAANAQRFVGGVHVTRTHRGDPGEKPAVQPIGAADQRRALRLVNTYILAENAFPLPASYFGKLVAPYNPDLVQAVLGSAMTEIPVRDTLSNIQVSAMKRLFTAATLRRIATNEYRAGDDPSKVLTLPSLFNSVRQTVWSELGAGRPITSLRRQLQRAHLETMADMVLKPGAVPEDARMVAWDQLRRLRAGLQQATRRAAPNEYTRIHLAESLMRVDRALSAQQTVGAPAAPTSNLLQALLGGKKP